MIGELLFDEQTDVDACDGTVAYLECAKGGGPGGLGDEVPQKLTLFCY